MNIATPDIYWEDGHLLSSRFNDVYSSRADALAETRYVFLDQSGFAQAVTAQRTTALLQRRGLEPVLIF